MRRHRLFRAGQAQRVDVVDDVGAIQSARRITSGLTVSTESGTPNFSALAAPAARAQFFVQRHRRGARRVDSPPMSGCRPLPPAASRSAPGPAASSCGPPSENESGVTLTMPITCGRARSMRKRVVCQNMVMKTEMTNGAAPRSGEKKASKASGRRRGTSRRILTGGVGTCSPVAGRRRPVLRAGAAACRP